MILGVQDDPLDVVSLSHQPGLTIPHEWANQLHRNCELGVCGEEKTILHLW